MKIDERIAERHRDLSPQERRAAATLLEHLDDLATYRAAELAALAGVSKATMSRLFRSLGYADFDEVREQLRETRHRGEPRRVAGGGDLPGHVLREAEAVRRAIEQPALHDAVALLVAARRVLVVGWRNSHPVALHLRQQLTHLRADVRLAPLPGQVLAEELADLTSGDLVVAVGFSRRPAGFGAFVAEARATGADVLLLADPTAIEHVRLASVWLECSIATELAFDSYAAAMSLVSALVDGALSAAGDPAQDRVSAITAAYARLAEIEA